MENKNKIILTFVIGLIGGAVLTAVGTHFYFHYCRDGKEWADKPGYRQKRFLSKLDKKLKLTSEQRTKIEQILNEKHKKIQDLRGEVRPKFKALRESAQSEIRAVLTAEQQTKFDELIQKHEKWMEKKRSRG